MAKYPILLMLFSCLGLTLSAWLGALYRKRHNQKGRDVHEQLNLVVGATLTLLALIIGFTFSMAVTRYDVRKNYEEAEANAIGTEFLRAELLPADDAAKVRELLLSYIDQRVLFYTVRDAQQIREINSQTAKLQAELWSVVRANAQAQPTAVAALAVAGMNDVLNSQGYTQAAWWNRIPVGAWSLLVVIAVFSNALIGFTAYKAAGNSVLWVLPFLISISFFLIADIEAPRRGSIKVVPENLLSLSESLHSLSPAVPQPVTKPAVR